jgi:hypothetical protein
MSEDNKPKIDLKARLGKKTVTGRVDGPSIPPPVGIPKPQGVAPAPGFGSSPVNPVIVDSSSPYAPAIEAAHAPQRHEPQAIKVEIGEDVVQSQKKARKTTFIFACVAAVIGIVLGFAVGSRSQESEGWKKAAQGAQGLVKEVDEANVQVQAMVDVLKAIGQKLGEGKYPEEEINKLGGINIPFSGANLAGRGIGLYKAQVVTQLIQYAGIATEANEQKDKIRRVLSGSREAIQELLADKEAPKVRWGVYVQSSPSGPIANMQPIPQPFALGQGWPESFQVKNGNQTTTLKRYTKGDLGSPSEPEMIPVAPQTQSLVCPSDTMVKLGREVRAMQELVSGDPTPGQEKPGLVELGGQIVEQLKKIGAS